ncbi:phage major capsid protein [Helicobacter sp. 11S02629-2]|uniref:phage major capsid protein n=1 Tax=Helicobacter sp. 11S02629-2 TaxID=1476195 RepID=UPI000BA75C95|nr:phage major capsid protein [Helicobacter sp. 11S02629-2]PAF44181.1 hypothetical protein BKH40_06180 [Helicobacter sp. 11S02629-2]
MILNFNSNIVLDKDIDSQNLIISFKAITKSIIPTWEGNLIIDPKVLTFNAQRLYLDHKVSFETAIGKIIDHKLEEDALKIKVQFFKDIPSSYEAFLKYQNGLSESVSIGLRDYDYNKIENKGQKDSYEIIKGEIYEISAVYEGADPKAKISNFTKHPIQPNLQNTKEGENMETLTNTTNKNLEELESLKKEALMLKKQKEEAQNIATFAKLYTEHASLASKAIAEGLSFVEFSELVKEEKTKDEAKDFALKNFSSANFSQPKKETRSFSFGRAIKSMTGSGVDASFEQQFFSNNKFEIPDHTLLNLEGEANTTKPSDTAVSPASNPYLKSTNESLKSIIPTYTRFDRLIDLLSYESNLMPECDIMDGVVGKQDLPVDENDIIADFVDEGVSGVTRDLKFGTISVSPHSISCPILITRTMLNMSELDLNSYIIRKLRESIRKRIEHTIINGNEKGKIKGILGEASHQLEADYFISAKTTGKKATLDMIKKLADKYSLANAKFLLSQINATNLQGLRPDDKSTDKWLVNDENTNLLGRPLLTSVYMPDNQIIYGDLKNVQIATWGKLEIIPIQKEGGNIYIEALYDVDIKLKDPKAFVINKKASSS